MTYEELKAIEDRYTESLNERLRINPNDVEALIHKAVMFYDDLYRDSKEAKSILLSVIAKYPNNIDAHMWLAEFLCFKDCNYEEAETYLRKALAIDSNRADCHMVLAGTLENMDKLDEAAFHYRRAFELEPTWIGARQFLANILFKKGELEQARYELEEALKYVRDEGWPTANPVEDYYEGLIAARDFPEVRKSLIDFIEKIDEAEAAAKLETKE